MAKTKSQLIARTLAILKAIDAGEAPSVEDSATVTAQIGATFAELGARSVYYVGDQEAIDDKAFEALARRLAEDLAPDFGASTSADAIKFWEGRLRDLNPPAGIQPIRAEYF